MPAEIDRSPIWRTFVQQLRYRPRLLISIGLGVAIYLALPTSLRVPTRALIGWDIATVCYLVMFFRLAMRSAPDKIRERAKLQDDGAVMTLIFSTAAASMCFVAIAFELAGLKDAAPGDKAYHLILVACTLPTAWMFIHSMFALHYAHEYYDALDGKGHGLEFPGHTRPTYWDFMYFSYIIGTSGQTADVGISGASMRRIATAHCVFAFFFNLGMLGLSVNVASSLL